uniref:Leucine zipper tumor suppressor 1 n=1 Tax=Anas platyrhynchos platyrhynchos TaxID=8840 RepID=A0A493TD15_ANAPP
MGSVSSLISGHSFHSKHCRASQYKLRKSSHLKKLNRYSDGLLRFGFSQDSSHKSGSKSSKNEDFFYIKVSQKAHGSHRPDYTSLAGGELGGQAGTSGVDFGTPTPQKLMPFPGQLDVGAEKPAARPTAFKPVLPRSGAILHSSPENGGAPSPAASPPGQRQGAGAEADAVLGGVVRLGQELHVQPANAQHQQQLPARPPRRPPGAHQPLRGLGAQHHAVRRHPGQQHDEPQGHVLLRRGQQDPQPRQSPQPPRRREDHLHPLAHLHGRVHHPGAGAEAAGEGGRAAGAAAELRGEGNQLLPGLRGEAAALQGGAGGPQAEVQQQAQANLAENPADAAGPPPPGLPAAAGEEAAPGGAGEPDEGAKPAGDQAEVLREGEDQLRPGAGGDSMGGVPEVGGDLPAETAAEGVPDRAQHQDLRDPQPEGSAEGGEGQDGRAGDEDPGPGGLPAHQSHGAGGVRERAPAQEERVRAAEGEGDSLPETAAAELPAHVQEEPEPGEDAPAARRGGRRQGAHRAGHTRRRRPLRGHHRHRDLTPSPPCTVEMSHVFISGAGGLASSSPSPACPPLPVVLQR